jgi:hypothetical protein
MPASDEAAPMSRKLLAFLLSELNTVRIICKSPGCGAVIEVSFEQMRVFFQNPRCAICSQPFVLPNPSGHQATANQPNEFIALGEAVARLKSNLSRADIEFILPDNSASTATQR